jgi:hypothetical protein
MIFKDIIESLLVEESRIDFLKNQSVGQKKLTEKEFNTLLDNDPTPNKKYLQVLIKWVLQYKKPVTRDIDKRRNEINYRLFFEDLAYKIKSNLELHNRIPNKFRHVDILKYPTAEDFNSDGAHVKDNTDYLELTKGKQKKVVYEDTFKIGETKTFNVYKLPKGRFDLYPASKYFASGTDWCTKGSDQFENYIKMDELFIFISKVDPTEKYQFHAQEMQLADKFDDQMLVRNIPDYETIVPWFKMCDILHSIPEIKTLVKNFMEEIHTVLKKDQSRDALFNELRNEINNLYDHIKDHAYETIANEVTIKHEKEFLVESSKSLIELREPEIYDYCVNVLGFDLNDLMEKSEDMTSTWEWEEYSDQHFSGMIHKGIEECILVGIVIREIKKTNPDFEW